MKIPMTLPTRNDTRRKRGTALLAASIGLLVALGTLTGATTTLRAEERLRLATTTSVQDSGLMPYLMSRFEKLCNCSVHVIAVGSGQALKLAENGDVDMVLVHDPDAEKEFVDKGWGINRKTFMVNDFVILGPQSDPAGVKGMKDAARAFAKIRESGALFVSRGDASGTHQKEKRIWKKAGIQPSGAWYFEVGQGMGAVLTMAEEKRAYTICDRATYLARQSRLTLRVQVEGDPDLVNYYSAIQVNPARHPAIQSALSRRLVDWLCSEEGRQMIERYRVGGNQLFTPIFRRGN